MRIIVSGGHFSPAHSIIKELKKRGHGVALAGRKYTFEGDSVESLEYQIAKKENILFFEIKTGRIQRRFSRHTVFSFLKVPLGLLNSISVISKFKPDIVITFGGYIGFVVSYASFLKKIPVILHEQTQRAGLSAKLISVIAKKVCISFESSRNYFPSKKVVFTGIPIREEIYTIKKSINVELGYPVIYITGGSSGSHFINSLVFKVLDALVAKFVIIHQTGDSLKYNDFNILNKKRESLNEEAKKRYILRKFIYPDEIGYVLNTADLVVARSGINTVVELLSCGATSLLIPLSHGQQGEQLQNAKLINEAGIGEYIEERYITPNKLIEKIKEMAKNKKKYEKYKEEAKRYVVLDATQRIVRMVEEVYDEKTG